MASAAVHSKAGTLLLFIHCLLLLPVCVVSLFNSGILGILSKLSIILLMKREMVALLSLCCGCLCFVLLFSSAVDLSAIVDEIN